MMSYPRLSPAMPAAQQVRTTALGVNGGGSQGRMSQMHKGVGLNKSKGGLNVHGSAPKAAKPPMPRTFARPNNGWRRVVRNGRPVLVAWDRLTPAERQRFVPRQPARPPVTDPKVVVTPRPSTVPPATQPPAAEKKLDWGSLSSYQDALADIDLEAGDKRAELQRQLANNQTAFDLGVKDGKQGFERGLEDAEIALNRQGLLRSGKRERVEADATQEFDRYMQDLEMQYGSGASIAVNAELTSLAKWEALQRERAEAAARAEFAQIYPAAPVAEPKPASPSKLKQSGLDASIFKNKYLQVWDAKRKRNVARSVEKMTREEILRAVARPINQRALAAGWRVVNGRIVKG